ncbi:polysaccharide deacetylase family protein [Paenibacillus sp. NEAU-GSW1]|uniref:polysaccharide deacetylase family protein n=1 Tax=Paenibacillus sp. NEAU-GSW1 TaxID=2682486 RepID=UPI0015668699|nr:polysaccharide deacetylase family protein [Paenibacillus sp. NEAU-GSW1]
MIRKHSFNSIAPMKSIVLLLLIGLTAMLAAACSQTPAAPAKTTFVVNGEKLKQPPAVEVEKGEPLVSAVFLEDTFDVKLEWALQQGNGKDGDGVFYSDQVAVLMYHDITATPEKDKSAITPDLFREQLELLKTSGFQVISLKQYADFILRDGAVPDNAVLITFDDGYETFYTNAFPILKEYGYPAVNFVIVSSVGDTTKEGAPKMTWDQMREMQKQGMDFYNHTYDSHRYGVMREDGMKKPVLTRKQYFADEKRLETDEEYTARVTNDLAEAEKILKQELGNPMGVLAFPYGAYNEQVLDILEKTGIELSFTVKEGINGKGQTNGFRVNGAKEGESAKQLLEKLKGLTVEDGAVTVSLNGSEAAFAEVQPVKRKEGVMIPLRDFCKMNNMKLDWNSNKNRVEIST